jgi:hypothetical protein
MLRSYWKCHNRRKVLFNLFGMELLTMKECKAGAWVLPILKDIEAFLLETHMNQSADLVAATVQMVLQEAAEKQQRLCNPLQVTDPLKSDNVIRFGVISRQRVQQG